MTREQAFGRGQQLEASGRPAEALVIYEQLVKAHPRWGPGHFGVGNANLALQRLDRAMTALEKALRLDGGRPETHARIATVLLHRGDVDKALAALDRALALAPGHTQSLVMKAEALRTAGDLAGALAAVEGAFAGGDRHPALVATFAQLAGKLGRAGEGITALEASLAESKQDPLMRSSGLFRLGELLDSIGEYDRAFAVFVEANHSRGGVYSREREDRVVADRKRLWTGERMAGLPRSRSTSEVPVFVLGMPRSGTSLVEQIIASHPKAAGAGETAAVIHAAVELLEPTRAEPTREGRLESLKSAAVDRVSRGVLKKIIASAAGRSGVGAERVTDKTPQTFVHLGLVELMLPRARVIHCVRSPLDTCLSCFVQDFVGRHNQGYSYDMANLAHAFGCYREAMSHWAGVIGLEMLEVSYEAVVADQEAQTRRIIEFVGLEWDEACLRFHETKRPVTTLSVDQVRRPMYSSSVGRWKNYEKHLGPLIAGLGELADG